MSTVNMRQDASALGHTLNAPKWAEEAWTQFRTAVKRRWQYLIAVQEMENLSDRSLQDLGIRRGDIRRLAREAVYGRG